MRRQLAFVSLMAAVCVVGLSHPASAQVVSLQFDAIPLNLLPGDTFTLTGSVTNTTANTVFLHGDAVSLDDQSVNIFFDDTPFFLNAPGSLDPNGTAGGTDAYAGPFLDVTIGSDVAPGFYAGSFGLSGGATSTLDDPLGTIRFGITVTPEPGAWASLAAMGTCGIGLLARRKTRRGN